MPNETQVAPLSTEKKAQSSTIVLSAAVHENWMLDKVLVNVSIKKAMMIWHITDVKAEELLCCMELKYIFPNY